MRLVTAPECVRFSDVEESITQVFFHFQVERPLCKLLESFEGRILHGKFFVQEASSVCSNVVLSLNRKEHCMFLCLLSIIRVVCLSHFRCW